MGESPSHPELLDWLVGEFARTGGSLKQLHKLMLTSATYRQSSHPSENPSPAELARWQSAQEIDPENRLLWRANRQATGRRSNPRLHARRRRPFEPKTRRPRRHATPCPMS